MAGGGGITGDALFCSFATLSATESLRGGGGAWAGGPLISSMLLSTIEERKEGFEIARGLCVSVGRLSKPSSDILPSSKSSPISCISLPLLLLLLLLLPLILPLFSGPCTVIPIAARRAGSSFGISALACLTTCLNLTQTLTPALSLSA